VIHQAYEDLLNEAEELKYAIDQVSCDCTCSCHTGNPPCSHCTDHWIDPAVYAQLDKLLDHITLMKRLFPGIGDNNE
jgi:hypothetical protein